MGHALEKAHRLLKPGGVLLESHFTGELTSLEVHHEGQVKYAGPVHRDTGFETFKQAKAALDRTVKDGMFMPVGLRIFDDCVHADTFDALRDWMAGNAKSLTIHDKVARKVDALVGSSRGATQVVLRRQTRMGRLKREGGQSEHQKQK